MLPYVTTRMFYMQNVFDTYQVGQLGVPEGVYNEDTEGYVSYFGRSTINSTAAVMSGQPANGIFLASCYEHTGGLGVGGSTTIGGRSSGEVLGDWFYGRGEVEDWKVLYQRATT